MPDPSKPRAAPRPDIDGGALPHQDARVPTILLVEDQEEMRVFLSEVLTQEGYRVMTASNGLDAISLLEAQHASYGHLPDPSVDLIITDYRMPGATGLELLEHLRRNAWRSKVILISAFADSRLNTEAHELGAVAILAKPFSVRELLGRVTQYIG